MSATLWGCSSADGGRRISIHNDTNLGNLLLSAEFQSGMGQPQAIKDTITWVRSVVPDCKLSIEEMIAEGDKVVMRWQMSGTNLGPDHAPDGTPMPPTGKPFTYTGITINQVVNGKIVADVYENSWTTMLIKRGRGTL